MDARQRVDRTTVLQAWITRRGGVAHTRDVRAGGFSPHDIACAVRSGALVRIRRSWLATRESDEAARTAAALGGRLTCVSLAARMGLWVPSVDVGRTRPHVSVPHSRSRVAAGAAIVHWAKGPVPVSPTATRDPILNVLFHVARCLPRIDALAVWESALRQRHVEPGVLARTRWRSTRAAELAEQASVLSDSGLETVYIDGMRRVGVHVRQQVWIAGHPVDGLIGERLVTQIDGFAHHRAGERRRDIRHDAELVLLGYTVLRFDYQQILFDWEHVESTVLTAIAQGVHLAR
jgi:very-short-patch-repair endonuclease